MGLGSAFKKAFKKIRKIADPAGIIKQPKAQQVQPDVAEVIPPAAAVEAPTKTTTETETNENTESDRKKARAGGKKSLSVSRSGGGGINL